MRIGEGSFYNTIKSKKQLYLLCLKHYNDTVSRRRLDALLSESSVQKGVRAFFKTVLDELDNPRTPRICLLAGSLSSDVLAEKELQHTVLSDMALFGDRFTERMEAAKKAGELPKEFQAAPAAQVVLTYLQGMFRMVRVLYDRAEIEAQIECLLTGLGV
jgi:TetR/AcrR family transcriptional repressor of nem operon